MIKAEQRYEWSLEEFRLQSKSKKTLVEFCPNGKNDQIRPYFDFDGKASTLDQLPNPADVLPHLRSIVHRLFHEEAADVACAIKANRTVSKGSKVEHKLSIRLFIPNLSTNAIAMKKAVKYANELVEKNVELQHLLQHCIKEEFGFDEGIYSRNRAMSLVGKPKDENDLTILQQCDNERPLEDFLITYIPEYVKHVPTIVQRAEKIKDEAISQKTTKEAQDSNHMGLIKFTPLSKDFVDMMGKAADTLLWKHTALERSHKMEPQTKWCSICKREHSAQQFCVYVNANSVTRHCGSAGTEMIELKESKRIIQQFNKLVLNITKEDEETNAFQLLQKDLWAYGEEHNLKREKGTGHVYKAIKIDNDELHYAYVFHLDLDDFIQSILEDNAKFTSQVNNLRNLKELLSTYNKPEFPFIKQDMDLYGFRNGVLNIRTMVFTPRKDIAKGSPICRKYLDVELSENDTHEHPYFDSLLDYQMEADVKDFLMMSMGRTFFRTNDLDYWQYMVYLYGQTGTGKSCVIDLLKFLHRKFETIGEGYNPAFGGLQIASTDIFLLEETPHSIKKVFPQETFQSMVSGGVINNGGKYVNTVSDTFTTPLFWAGNYFLDYFDKGQLSRRTKIIEFPNIIPPQVSSTTFPKHLEKESGAILYNCLRKYHEYVRKFGDQNSFVFTPDSIRDTVAESRRYNDPFYRFLSDPEKVEYASGSSTLLSDVKAAFEKYLGKSITTKLEHGTFMQIHTDWTVTQLKICRLCQNTYASKPKCCPESDRSHRTSGKQIVHNLMLKK